MRKKNTYLSPNISHHRTGFDQYNYNAMKIISIKYSIEGQREADWGERVRGQMRGKERGQKSADTQ